MAYLNAHDGYKAHDWTYDNLDLMSDYTHIIGGTRFAENMVIWYCSSTAGEVTEHYYNWRCILCMDEFKGKPTGGQEREYRPKRLNR